MEIVFEDNRKRAITQKEEIVIPINLSGYYLVEVAARPKGKKQLGSGMSEGLSVEFLGQKFLPDSPASFSGSNLQGKLKMDNTIEQIASLGYKIDDPYDADQSINGAMIYFKWLLSLYEGQQDQLPKALAAWNWGMAHVPVEGPFDWQNFPGMHDETKNFIKFVLNL